MKDYFNAIGIRRKINFLVKKVEYEILYLRSILDAMLD